MHSALIPWLDPATLIGGFGPFALLGVAFIVFAETGLLVGFLLPGDTLLVAAGVLAVDGAFGVNIWWVCAAISLGAFLGGELGYFIGHKAGPRIFERNENGLFSKKNVERTNAFFTRYGGLAVIMARFVPVIRTFAPVAAGVGHMNYKKYTLYNLIGAIVWGTGLTMVGFGVGHIPVVAAFVQDYIDIVLLGVVVVVLIPSLYHYIQALVKGRKAKAAHAAMSAAGTSAENLVLDPDVFSQKHDGAHEADSK
jgi:membrane-associated protein